MYITFFLRWQVGAYIDFSWSDCDPLFELSVWIKAHFTARYPTKLAVDAYYNCAWFM